MRILMPQGEPINFDGIDRKLLFNINVIDELQEHYDMNIADVFKLILTTDPEKVGKSYDNLCYILSVLVNEDTRIYNKTASEKREIITESEIKEYITHGTANVLTYYVLKAFNKGMPKKGEEDDDPNVKSE